MLDMCPTTQLFQLLFKEKNIIFFKHLFIIYGTQFRCSEIMANYALNLISCFKESFSLTHLFFLLIILSLPLDP